MDRIDWRGAPEMSAHARLDLLAQFETQRSGTLDPVAILPAADRTQAFVLRRRERDGSRAVRRLPYEPALFHHEITPTHLQVSYDYLRPRRDPQASGRIPVASGSMRCAAPADHEELRKILQLFWGDPRGILPAQIGLANLLGKDPTYKPTFSGSSPDGPWHKVTEIKPAARGQDLVVDKNELLAHAGTILEEGWDEAAAGDILTRFFGDPA